MTEFWLKILQQFHQIVVSTVAGRDRLCSLRLCIKFTRLLTF
ncbi:MAG: hypothetical protein RMY62_002510 [Nostoc sp. ZfuVER08]|nr:hypothetical protein [Nostoc punctiforme]MDZ8012264.1 hypothetical protein [Nostoc sp. ZfuVER08]